MKTNKAIQIARKVYTFFNSEGTTNLRTASNQNKKYYKTSSSWLCGAEIKMFMVEPHHKVVESHSDQPYKTFTSVIRIHDLKT